MVMSMDIGKYLAVLRDDADLKQREVAQEMKWSPAVLSRIESGERPVSLDELRLIVEAIDTNKAWDFLDIVQREWRILPKPPLGHPNESLLWEAEQSLRDIKHLSESDKINKTFANRLEEFNEELTDSAMLVLRTEHSVALVGDIGVGKSTAICRAAGLEIHDDKTDIPVPVLEVGGGGVTVCEVHIAQGPQYGLIIEPMSDPELQNEVHEFARVIRTPSAVGQGKGAEDVELGTTKEIGRAIRNMSGLIQTRSRPIGPDRKRRSVVKDPAKDLAENFNENLSFVAEILARMHLERRTKRELWYPKETSEKQPLAWLKENFELVNNGRHPDFSIPKRIEIVVPDSILNNEEALDIRIIDTKGVDSLSARADLESLFSEASTVVVLCSTFNATPSPSVQQLLKRVRAGMISGVRQRVAVLGLPRYDEALAVKDDEGFQSETIQEGYGLKYEQAETVLQQIGFPDLPIGFFNSLRDNPENLRTLLLELVEGLRSQQQEDLKEIIEDARSLIANFEQELTKGTLLEAAMHLQTWLEHNAELDFANFRRPEVGLIRAMNRAYASSVRASIRRQGEWYNLNYSQELSFGTRINAANMVQRKLNDFSAVVDNLLNNDQLQEAHGLLRQARRVVENGVDDLLEKCQFVGRRIHSRDMKPNTQLWRRCDNEWGRGPGYRDRVVRHHNRWFKDDDTLNYHEIIQLLIEREWKTTLTDLSAILEISDKDG